MTPARPHLRAAVRAAFWTAAAAALYWAPTAAACTLLTSAGQTCQ